MENSIFITITGCNNYFGKMPFKAGRIFKLEKEPNNAHDTEAIKVYHPFFDTVGYVANSIYTVYEGTYSAGRLYDKMENTAYVKVMFVTHSSVIARLLPDEEVTDKF